MLFIYIIFLFFVFVVVFAIDIWVNWFYIMGVSWSVVSDLLLILAVGPFSFFTDLVFAARVFYLTLLPGFVILFGEGILNNFSQVSGSTLPPTFSLLCCRLFLCPPWVIPADSLYWPLGRIKTWAIG